MPCDTIQYTELDVSKMRPEMLKKALESMGYSVTMSGQYIEARKGRIGLSINAGRLVMAEGAASRELEQNIQKAYSREIVRTNARKAGFQVREKTDYQLELVKRY